MPPVVRLDPDVLVATPGEEVLATVVVANPGSVTGLWRLDVAGRAAPWCTVEPAEVVVPAGGQARCRLRVLLPAASPHGTGTVPLSVAARGAVAEDAGEADGVIEVVGTPALALRMEPKSSRGVRGASHRAVVDNRAGSPTRVVLAAAAPDDLDVAIDPDSLVVEAESTATARVVVRPRQRIVRGAGRRHRFEVRADPMGGTPVSASATMVQRPLSTGLAPGLVAAVVAVVLAGFALSRLAGDSERTELRSGGAPDGVAVPGPGADPFAGPSVPPDETVAPDATAGEATTTTVAAAPPVTAVPPVPDDERRIAFQTMRDGNSEIYVVARDGSGLVNLTNSPSHDSEPAWSPDGHRLAFDSNRGGNGFDVWLMAADGSGVTRLTSEPAADGYPAWSPDGSRIAFVSLRDGNSEIYVMNADGTAQRRLTTNPADDSRPSWSPDGTRIAFHTNRDGNFEVYAMSASDGGGAVNLTRHPSSDLNPAWAPDGARVAFDSTRDGPNAEIYVMGADGAAPTRLTAEPAKDFWPAWSRDSTAIAFQSGRDGDQEVYVVRPGGGPPVRLTASPGLDGEPSW